MAELSGLFVPLITPFTADGELALDALEQLAHRVLDDGATGIVALGTTAEAATLTQAEQAAVLDLTSRVCRERAVPLIAEPARMTRQRQPGLWLTFAPGLRSALR